MCQLIACKKNPTPVFADQNLTPRRLKISGYRADQVAKRRQAIGVIQKALRKSLNIIGASETKSSCKKSSCKKSRHDIPRCKPCILAFKDEHFSYPLLTIFNKEIHKIAMCDGWVILTKWAQNWNLQCRMLVIASNFMSRNNFIQLAFFCCTI